MLSRARQAMLVAMLVAAMLVANKLQWKGDVGLMITS